MFFVANSHALYYKGELVTSIGAHAKYVQLQYMFLAANSIKWLRYKPYCQNSWVHQSNNCKRENIEQSSIIHMPSGFCMHLGSSGSTEDIGKWYFFGCFVWIWGMEISLHIEIVGKLLS